MSDHCKSCGAPIEWAITPKGRRIPLDPGEALDGNIVVDANGTAQVVVPGSLFAQAGTMRRSHFASCPYAAQHRRRRK